MVPSIEYMQYFTDHVSSDSSQALYGELSRNPYKLPWVSWWKKDGKQSKVGPISTGIQFQTPTAGTLNPRFLPSPNIAPGFSTMPSLPGHVAVWGLIGHEPEFDIIPEKMPYIQVILKISLSTTGFLQISPQLCVQKAW